MSVSISGNAIDAFQLSATSLDIIAPGDSRSFTISVSSVIEYWDVETYTATVKVMDQVNDLELSLDLSITIIPK